METTTIAKRGGGSNMEIHRTRTCCFRSLATLIALLLILLLVALILGFTVMKPKNPITTVDSVSLDHLRIALDIPNLAIRLNLSLALSLSVKNPNKVGFRHSNASAFLLYGGDVVGEAPIQAGEISSDSTNPMNLTLTLLADKLMAKSGVYSAVVSGGVLPFTTSTTLKGKVCVMRVLNIRVVSRAVCDFRVQVWNRSVDRADCRYHTNL